MDKPDPQDREGLPSPETAKPDATGPAAQTAPEQSASTEAEAPERTVAETATRSVFPQLDTEDSRNALTTRDENAGNGINAMLNVGLDVQIVLGHARMPISRLLELTRGSIVELNRKIGAPVDLMVNDRLVARGDLVKVGEDRLGVSLTQIVKDHAAD